MAASQGYADTLLREFELPRLGTLGLRLRVWCTSSRLTRALAAGASPVESRELALRARQITGTRIRTRLAGSIDDLIDQAMGGSALMSAQVPVDRVKVMLARIPLLELAERLRSREPVTARGMAYVVLLLTDPAKPLYGCAGAVDLVAAIIDVRQMLDEPSESRLEL